MNSTPAARTTTAVPHRGSTAAWTLGVPAAVATVAGTLAATWRKDLPEPLAVHWGSDGVDGYGSFLAFTLPFLGAISLAAIASWAVGSRLGRGAMTRRVANAAAVWLAVFLGSVLVSTLDAQRGLADAASAEVGDGAMALGLTLATVSAALAAWLTPPDPAQPTSRPIPERAATLPLSSSEQAAWVREVGVRSSVPPTLAALTFAAFIGAASGLWLFAGALGLFLALLLVTTLRWSVAVDGNGLTARSRLRRPSLHVPLDEVEHAEVVDVDPFREFGGWGLRTGFDGRTGVVLRKGAAIAVHRTGGRVVVVTVDEAATGAALLNTLAGRQRATD